MSAITGVFRSSDAAQRAIEQLHLNGIDDNKLTLLSPGSQVKTSPTEQPGMGPAVGGVVGGALGVAAASMLIPGVGLVLIAGAAALGLGGALAGAAAGHAVESNIFDGLPADELFFYEDALRQGRSVVIAFADNDEQADAARTALVTAGAESINAAQHEWWLGVRDDERIHYRSQGGDFDADEATYRRGFQAALLRPTRGKSYEEALDYLRKQHPDASAPGFRHGYDRGHHYYEQLQHQQQGGWIHG